jgi:hypothetical protein
MAYVPGEAELPTIFAYGLAVDLPLGGSTRSPASGSSR